MALERLRRYIQDIDELEERVRAQEVEIKEGSGREKGTTQALRESEEREREGARKSEALQRELGEERVKVEAGVRERETIEGSVRDVERVVARLALAVQALGLAQGVLFLLRLLLLLRSRLAAHVGRECSDCTRTLATDGKRTHAMRRNSLSCDAKFGRREHRTAEDMPASNAGKPGYLHPPEAKHGFLHLISWFGTSSPHSTPRACLESLERSADVGCDGEGQEQLAWEVRVGRKWMTRGQWEAEKRVMEDER
eukprot:713797-Rhodomonas_salina.2